LVLPLFVILVTSCATTAGAQEESSDPGVGESRKSPQLTARELSPDRTIPVAKSPTSRLARTDRSLLGLQSRRPINLIVKLDYDPVATYAGGIENLRPTSPRVTGRSLEVNRDAVREYLGFVRDFEADVRGSISSTVPQARVITSFRIAYGGLALRVPANRADDLLQIDGIVAVQRDELNQPQTDTTPEFIGATEAWGSLGGRPGPVRG
jgi:hypothetical protein